MSSFSCYVHVWLVGSFVCCVCGKGRKSGDEAAATSVDNNYFTLS